MVFLLMQALSHEMTNDQVSEGGSEYIRAHNRNGSFADRSKSK